MQKIRVVFTGLCCLGLITGCAGSLQWRSSTPSTSGEERRKQAMQYFVDAKVFEAQKNYYGAIVALRNAADLDPTSPTIYEQLARNYHEIRDDQMSAVFAHKALGLDPGLTNLRYLLFQLLHLSGDQAGAAGELEKLIDSEPGSWRLYFQLAQLYMELGQSKRIAPLFERALKRDDIPIEVKVNIADIFARSGKQKKAETIYKGVLEAHPEAEDAWLGLADLQKARGHREEAIRYYLRAGRVLGESPMVFHELARLNLSNNELGEIMSEEKADFLYRLGVALSDAGKYAQAAMIFEFIVGLRPSSMEEWLDLARYYIYREDYERADEILEQAAETMPDSSSVFIFWGMAMEQADRLDKAIDIYRQGLKHNPAETELYLYWGFALEQKKEWPQAIQVYRQGLKLDPDDPELYIRWGIVLGKQHKWQEAIEQYRRAASLDLLDSTAFLHWGIALEKLGRWQEAIDKLLQAAELNEHDTHVLFYLGTCFEQASRQIDNEDYFERAIETFEQLLEIDPHDAYALNYLGYMYADKGIHLEEAVKLLLHAIDLEPDNSAFFDSLGWAFFRLGKLQRAEHYLNKALETLNGHENDEKVVILDHAGDIARALGKEAEARKHWQRALELIPDNEEVRDKLELSGTP